MADRRRSRRPRDGDGRRLPRAGDDPLAGQGAAGKVESGIISGLDWFPTFWPRRQPEHRDELKKGKTLGDRTYKVHLDGYNQMDLITARAVDSQRSLVLRESELGRASPPIGRLQVSLHRPTGRLAGRQNQA